MWYYMYPPTEQVKNLPMYLISIGLHQLQPFVERKNGHSYDQFFYNSSGSGTLKMYGKTYHLPEGSAFFIPANVPHCYYPDEDEWDIRWMVVAGSGLNAVYETLKLTGGGVFTIENESRLDVILNKMRHEILRNKENGEMVAAGYVYPFLIEFAMQTTMKKKVAAATHPYDDYMNTLRDYIDYHFMYPITMKDLCDVISVSPQHLCRIFKTALHMRPMEYVARIRIDKAKELLQHTPEAIQGIAYKCGYQNTNYFCRHFKQLEGVTPGEYRKSSF